MNFWVAKMYENNNGMSQKYRDNSYKALPQVEVTLTGNYYCKCSITNVGTVSDNETNFLPLPYSP